MKKAILIITLFTLYGCDKPTLMMSSFEKFAYEGCINEGKYTQSICACNAKNLDKSLSDEEKVNYKKAALGDTKAAFKLIGSAPKLLEAIQSCAN